MPKKRANSKANQRPADGMLCTLYGAVDVGSRSNGVHVDSMSHTLMIYISTLRSRTHLYEADNRHHS